MRRCSFEVDRALDTADTARLEQLRADFRARLRTVACLSERPLDVPVFLLSARNVLSRALRRDSDSAAASWILASSCWKIFLRSEEFRALRCYRRGPVSRRSREGLRGRCGGEGFEWRALEDQLQSWRAAGPALIRERRLRAGVCIRASVTAETGGSSSCGSSSFGYLCY